MTRCSCHRQLYLIPFTARRTVRRGSFLLLLSSSSYVIFRFLFFHILFKTCEKESLYHQSIAFLCACFTRQSKKLHRTFTVCGVFPVYSFPQAISTPSLAFDNRLFSRISRNFSTGYSNIVEKFFAAGEGVWKTGKGPSAGFFPGFGPFEVDFLLFSQAATGFPHDLSTAVETAVDKFTDL